MDAKWFKLDTSLHLATSFLTNEETGAAVKAAFMYWAGECERLSQDNRLFVDPITGEAFELPLKSLRFYLAMVDSIDKAEQDFTAKRESGRKGGRNRALNEADKMPSFYP